MRCAVTTCSGQAAHLRPPDQDRRVLCDGTARVQSPACRRRCAPRQCWSVQSSPLAPPTTAPLPLPRVRQSPCVAPPSAESDDKVQACLRTWTNKAHKLLSPAERCKLDCNAASQSLVRNELCMLSVAWPANTFLQAQPVTPHSGYYISVLATLCFKLGSGWT